MIIDHSMMIVPDSTNVVPVLLVSSENLTNQVVLEILLPGSVRELAEQEQERYEVG